MDFVGLLYNIVRNCGTLYSCLPTGGHTLEIGQTMSTKTTETFTCIGCEREVWEWHVILTRNERGEYEATCPIC